MSGGISNTIRELRGSRSMAQRELADLIFVTRLTVNAIEGDNVRVRFDTSKLNLPSGAGFFRGWELPQSSRPL